MRHIAFGTAARPHGAEASAHDREAQMSTRSAPWLSKSRYQAGLQCPRRLWLGVHQRELAKPRSEGQQALLEAGTQVGERARHLFPGGVLVTEEASEHAIAEARTRALMADSAVPAIFEAAFSHAGVRIRVDVLERLAGGRFALCEVKSAAKFKKEHGPDLAVQLWVLRGCGVEIESAELIHVDTRFMRGAGPIDWSAFFKRVDVSKRIEPLAGSIAEAVGRLHGTLGEADAPDVEPGSQCTSPYPCEFWSHCTADKSPEWFIAQKRVREEQRLRWLEAARTGRTWVSGNLAKALARAAPPAWHLDFEALGPAIPLYPGTHPYRAIAFQWSLHRLEADGAVSHREFLARGDADPRRATAESLLAALSGDRDPVLVYSSYEDRQLADMADHAPDLADELEALRGRLVDLWQIVKRCVYHPAFGGSFSLKAVGPALTPHVDYGTLEGVADGTAAAGAFARIASGEAVGPEAERLRAELLEYCKLDTLALMEVHRALRGLAFPGETAS
jgi:predicted RecB family nuclease